MHDRREERFDARLAVRLEQGAGLTRNVSATGVYFETEVPLETGAQLSFTVQFDDSPGGALQMKCDARIVRVEHREGKLGVAAHIVNCTFERLAAAAG